MRELLSQQFSSSTLMDGEAIVRSEKPLAMPEDDLDLQAQLHRLEELRKLQVLAVPATSCWVDVVGRHVFNPEWNSTISIKYQGSASNCDVIIEFKNNQ